MYFVYVLRNPTSGHHYTGHTADLTQRIGQPIWREADF